jgi:hypothetical protein
MTEGMVGGRAGGRRKIIQATIVVHFLFSICLTQSTVKKAIPTNGHCCVLSESLGKVPLGPPSPPPVLGLIKIPKDTEIQ